MNIYYCDACRKRISDEDLTGGRAVRKGDFVYCAACTSSYVPKKKTPPGGISADAKRKSGGSPMRSGAVPPKSVNAVVNRRPKQGSVGLIIFTAGAVLAVTAIFVLIPRSQSKAERVAFQPLTVQKDATSANPNPPQSRAPIEKMSVIAAEPTKSTDNDKVVSRISPTTDPSIDDIRESFARRKWAAIKADVERMPNGWSNSKLVKDFAESYATTVSGKEAAEYLKSMKNNKPPPPPGAKVFANYKNDFKKATPAPGWRYLYNKDGNVGESGKYAPLVWNQNRDGYSGDPNVYPTAMPAAWGLLGSLGGHPSGGCDQGAGVDRFVIAAYTLQPGQNGKSAIAINIGRNDMGNGGRIELRLYLNDVMQGSLLIPSSVADNQVSSELGVLKEGDTIYVAVGPDREDSCDTFRMDFTIYPIP